MNAAPISVAVLDMQPIDPPTGGGRLRLLGLYHALGDGIDATYVGSYDWPGPGCRDHRLSPGLREIDVPLSAEHFRAADELRERTGGKTVIDSAFADLAHLSADYVAKAAEVARCADVVVFSHPWIYALVRDGLDPSRQLVVYDSHNVEGLLRVHLLDDGGAGTALARSVVRQEWELCRNADLVLACSDEDRQLFHALYGVEPGRIRVVANGVFTSRLRPADGVERQAARDALSVKRASAAIFLGSAYEPNVEAARFIAEKLAPSFPEVEFVVAGGVGDALPPEVAGSSPNLRVTGFLDEADMLRWLAAADVALNPMLSGSGTNIKMFDFMAAGLPVVTTPTGARGIETAGEAVFELRDPDDLAEGLARVLASASLRIGLATAGRQCVERLYSWERISADLGLLLRRQLRVKCTGRIPRFSVVIPSYARHASLTRLVELLVQQQEKDFEAVIVDQSAEPWPDRARDFGLDLLYIHTDIRGAISARNTGAFFATGEIIAFTDDDCEPSPGWLAAANQRMRDPSLAGLEGLVKSEHVGDPEWRAVTNEGFEGQGFMTANLFVRRAVFNRINGFDLAFDKPHFREDTDLGWRAQRFGEIPFCREAWVFHPAHRRDVARESLAERNRFFVKDALLYRKHPQRYKALLRNEGHHLSNPHFRRYFLEGVQRYGVKPDRELLEMLESTEATE